jgi:hypothetical protein
VEQVVVFETDGIVEIHTVTPTTNREACYKIYKLEQELAAKFSDQLFDFNLAVNRYKPQDLGKTRAKVAYDKEKPGKHAQPR